MKCSNCQNIINSTIQCQLCLSLFCSQTCLNAHYILIHNNQPLLLPYLSSKKPKNYKIPSPYIVNGILNSKIIYNELYNLKNFVEIKENGYLKKIGSGSYGEVYLAMNIINKKYYAIKHMEKKKLLELLHTLTGIYREINIQSRIDHPNIVKILYVKETEKSFDLVMDYASEGNLFHYIRKTKGLNENKAFCFFIQVVNAIYFLHKNNFIHRDIKPENLLLYNFNNLKLCDFGWCVSLQKGETRDTFCGTTEYMSPELVNHKHYSKEIDVWSLGVLLYEMIHGYSPFKPNKINFEEKDVMENIKNHKLKFRKQVSKECKELIYHLLDPDINNRYSVEDIFYSSFVKKYENKNFFIPKINKNNNIKNIKNVELSRINSESRINNMIYKNNNFSSNNIFNSYNNYSSINNVNEYLNNIYLNEIIKNNNNEKNIYIDSNSYLENNETSNVTANNFYSNNLDDMIFNDIIFEHTYNPNNQNINCNYRYFYDFTNYNVNNNYNTSNLIANSIHNKSHSVNTTVSTKNNGNQNNITYNNIITEYEVKDEKNLDIQNNYSQNQIKENNLIYKYMSHNNSKININENILLNNKEIIDNNRTQNVNFSLNQISKKLIKSNSSINIKNNIPCNYLKGKNNKLPQNIVYNNFKDKSNTLYGKYNNKENYIQDILNEFRKLSKNKNTSCRNNRAQSSKNNKRQNANLNNKQNIKKKKYLILKNSDIIFSRNSETNDDAKETPKKNRDYIRINPRKLLNCFMKEFKNFSVEKKSAKHLIRKK